MVTGKATNSVPRRRQNPLFSPNCQDCRLLTEARGQLTVFGGGARKSDKKTMIRMKGPATLSKATSRCEGTVDYHSHNFHQPVCKPCQIPTAFRHAFAY